MEITVGTKGEVLRSKGVKACGKKQNNNSCVVLLQSYLTQQDLLIYHQRYRSVQKIFLLLRWGNKLDGYQEGTETFEGYVGRVKDITRAVEKNILVMFHFFCN